ncbi:LPXTG cell wall anchor domain-containing protein [Bacillus cereus]|uniref:LPXTG cell wall anchor domain-containing protein n=1 Tax=Bacillus cereus TaxID=1396 RepID=UPI000BF9965C|nr:LPXTG cell wall anchor domain-containing protein [Bacillus cereus]PFO90341.1 hypothetical protein COJ97_28700 [Bacillus cereus]
MKKLMLSMITIVGIIHWFAPYDTILADQATSTAGIRFVEGDNSSINPNENIPSKPGGETTLPQTGGKASVPYYAVGIGLIGLASLLVMKSNIKKRGI